MNASGPVSPGHESLVRSRSQALVLGAVLGSAGSHIPSEGLIKERIDRVWSKYHLRPKFKDLGMPDMRTI